MVKNKRVFEAVGLAASHLEKLNGEELLTALALLCITSVQYQTCGTAAFSICRKPYRDRELTRTIMHGNTLSAIDELIQNINTAFSEMSKEKENELMGIVEQMAIAIEQGRENKKNAE